MYLSNDLEKSFMIKNSVFFSVLLNNSPLTQLFICSYERLLYWIKWIYKKGVVMKISPTSFYKFSFII